MSFNLTTIIKKIYLCVGYSGDFVYRGCDEPAVARSSGGSVLVDVPLYVQGLG